MILWFPFLIFVWFFFLIHLKVSIIYSSDSSVRNCSLTLKYLLSCLLFLLENHKRCTCCCCSWETWLSWDALCSTSCWNSVADPVHCYCHPKYDSLEVFSDFSTITCTTFAADVSLHMKQTFLDHWHWINNIDHFLHSIQFIGTYSKCNVYSLLLDRIASNVGMNQSRQENAKTVCY